MKTVNWLALFGSVVFLAAAVAVAQDFTKADHKMLGHRIQSSQEHAQRQAQTLYHYGQVQQPIPKDDAKEMLATMKKELAAADKALAKLKADVEKNKEAVELIESIKKHHANAHEQCGMAEEACAKPDTDKVVVGDCCSEMYFELEAAKADTAKLLKLLKIEKLEPPKKPVPKKK
jgi:hypothetical protein